MLMFEGLGGAADSCFTSSPSRTLSEYAGEDEAEFSLLMRANSSAFAAEMPTVEASFRALEARAATVRTGRVNDACILALR